VTIPPEGLFGRPQELLGISETTFPDLSKITDFAALLDLGESVAAAVRDNIPND
jgi:hypothetical protein